MKGPRESTICGLNLTDNWKMIYSQISQEGDKLNQNGMPWRNSARCVAGSEHSPKKIAAELISWGSILAKAVSDCLRASKASPG